jgi:glycerol-3-phosphate O-acyltransferase/dihydroxyacetone phosphate acyltransferase
MTAKDTLFGKKTFSSWLIESVGTVPVKRAKDYEGKRVDNTHVFARLMDAIDKQGDMVCLFPGEHDHSFLQCLELPLSISKLSAEGISHYSSYIAPLRSGVARITSDVLNRNLDNPDFELTLLTCSITYLHRESFRSDVLVSFNPPIKINVREHKELFAPASPSQTDKLDGIKQLTALMQEQIRHGTIDAPNFGVVRIANTARRLYAPLGTGMTLGDHVHITQSFVDAFAKRQKMKQPTTPAEALLTPLPTASTTALATTSNIAIERHPGTGYFDFDKASTNGAFTSDEEVEKLAIDLHVRLLPLLS